MATEVAWPAERRMMEQFEASRVSVREALKNLEKAFQARMRVFEEPFARGRALIERGEVEAGRELVYRAAWLDAQGGDCVKEVSMAKAYCGELTNEVMYDCLQFHGGSGYMSESAIERMYRDARVQSIGGGATEVMLEEVAKRPPEELVEAQRSLILDPRDPEVIAAARE